MSARRVKTWGGKPVADLMRRWDRENVYVYGEIGSTNTRARELADEGAVAGTVVMSRGQTAGRGRGDARFHSPKDEGVYLSMIFRPGGAGLDAPITTLAGIGVAMELERAFPDLRPALKWPNDLMSRDRKLGGILAEATRGPDGEAQLVVGVGVNLTTTSLPDDLRDRVIGVRECCEAEPGDVADAIVRGLERWLHEPPESIAGAVLDALDRLDWLKNRRIALTEAGDRVPVVGGAAGIAPDGALLFRPDRGALRRVATGSVEPLEDIG